MEEIKQHRQSIIKGAITDYEDKIKGLNLYIRDIKKQEKFFRNSEDKYLHLTVEGELRISRTKRDAYRSCLNTLKLLI